MIDRIIAVAIALCLTLGRNMAIAVTWSQPEHVDIDGYTGHAMEPFLSCDSQVLLFNNRNTPEDQTDVHWATRVTDNRFSYQGRVAGVNTAALEGVPSMDCSGNLYFVSPRSYDATLSTIYAAKFKDGRATDVHLVAGVSRKEHGIVNFDAEISSSGQELYAVDGLFDASGGPQTADIFLANQKGEGFVRAPRSAQIFANVNTDDLEYAPAVSRDGLELFFTRLSGAWFWRTLTMEYSRRSARDQPWGKSTSIASIKGYVEAPAISRNGKILYFHKDVDGRFEIFLVRRQ